MKMKYKIFSALICLALCTLSFAGCMSGKDGGMLPDSRGSGTQGAPLPDVGTREEESAEQLKKSTEQTDITAEKLEFIKNCEFPGLAGAEVGKLFDASFINPRWYMQSADELGIGGDVAGAEFPVFEGDCAHDGISTHVKLIFKLQGNRLSWHGAEIDGATVDRADIIGILSDCGIKDGKDA